MLTVGLGTALLDVAFRSQFSELEMAPKAAAESNRSTKMAAIGRSIAKEYKEYSNIVVQKIIIDPFLDPKGQYVEIHRVRMLAYN